MGIAKARRIAQHAHRGQLAGDGELFLDQLERLVGAVEERGGGWVARQAAWLHAVPATGVDLARLDLPWRVLRVVEALQPESPWSGPVLARLRQFPDAVLVHDVLTADRPAHHRPEVPVDALPRSPVDRERLLREAESAFPGVAGAAIAELTGAGDEREVELLRTVMLRPEREWRWARRTARARLTAIGGPAAVAALRQWVFSPLDVPWRDDRDWLRRNAADVVPRLVEVVSDPLWSYEAALALGELRVAEAVLPLCESARTADHPVMQVEALGKIGSAEALPTLVELLGHRNPEVRDHVLRALARIGDDQVVDVVLEACEDLDPRVRDRAARVLVRLGDSRAVPRLVRLCDTRHAAAAADALTRIGDPRALPTLWHLFQHHEDKAVRHAAGRGLARIEGEQQVVYPGDVLVLRAHVWLLGHKPDWHHHRLEQSVRHADAIVRARVAEAYGRLGTGAQHLRVLLDDPDPRVRAAARFATARQ
ncbi:hypothetical protein BBK82_44395 [Lentzea guizhouensis]|uniref:PBS lyase n=1 Tax=Lentzea guizhouensis TaxID=1586287 RepID=A0A1B2HW18_9PSEU|nr:HEAT repeat domain-containing protein [Lentzea guizhouensis]ANZ41936.1 hypothetical protein BBK82_44395 [Lentzea guizhouensis]